MRQRRGTARALPALGVVLCLLGGWRPAMAQGLDTSGFAGQVLSLLNQARAANGLPPLQESPALDASAQSYSAAMMQATAGGPVYLSHTGPDGSTFEDRINRAGYTGWTRIGENIAAGQPSPPAVVDAWMNSPGHRANILDAGFQAVGIGIAVGPGTWSDGYQDPAVIWWTTDFGSQGASAGSGAGQPSPPAVPLAPTPNAGPSSPPAASQPGGTPLAGTTNLGGTPAAGGLTPAAGSGAGPLALTLSLDEGCGARYSAGQSITIRCAATGSATLSLAEQMPDGTTRTIFAGQPVIAGQSSSLTGVVGAEPGPRTFTLTAAEAPGAPATCQFTGVP